jgi:hypothetical protein
MHCRGCKVGDCLRREKHLPRVLACLQAGLVGWADSCWVRTHSCSRSIRAAPCNIWHASGEAAALT